MATVDIANLTKPVAIALDWRALKGATSERKEIDALAKSEGVKFGCVISDDEAGVTIVGLSHEKAEGATCGAAWLAAACGRSAVILVEPLDDSRLWICAVRAGLPVQNMDVVIDIQDLHSRLQDFQLQSPDAKIYSTLENLEVTYERVSPQSFAELVANTPAPKIERIAGFNPLLVALVAMAVLAMAAWYGFDAYSTMQAREKAKIKLAKLNSDQERKTAESVAKAHQEYVAAAEVMLRNVVLDQPALDSVVGTIFAAVESKPLTMAGWSLVSFDCDARACRLHWKRGQGSTMLTFMTAAEGNGWVIGNIAGNDAVTNHALDVESRSASIDQLDESAPFLAAFESKLQEASPLGLRYEVFKPEPLEKLMPATKPVGGKAGLPAEPGQALPYKVGTATVRGTKLFELRELPNYVTHPGLSIKRVSVDVKSGEWTMEMNYATR
ncbi:type 4b pilus protein PilO2 [Paucibacter soli]|uniref:type 4b pilus protein PilO2 n=1 Tax=Paucibacter soli TaxID=3133433 RepID=UPI00309D4241